VRRELRLRLRERARGRRRALALGAQLLEDVVDELRGGLRVLRGLRGAERAVGRVARRRRPARLLGGAAWARKGVRR
jgi:hypothetical protein